MQTFKFLRYRVPLIEKLEHYIEICSYHLTVYHHATLIWLVPGHQYQGGKSLRNKSDLQESDSSDPEILQIRTKTIRTNQNYSDDSSSNTNEHDIALFQNEFQSSENIGGSTDEADGNSDSENTILTYRISLFHRLCREVLQDLENHPIVSVNGCRNWFFMPQCFMPKTVFIPNNCFYADCFYSAV